MGVVSLIAGIAGALGCALAAGNAMAADRRRSGPPEGDETSGWACR